MVVAIGPAAEYELLGAFELGRMAGITEAILHLGVCAGGALDVTIEEVPNPPPEQLSLPDPRSLGQGQVHELGRAAGAAAAVERGELTVVYDDDEESAS